VAARHGGTQGIGVELVEEYSRLFDFRGWFGPAAGGVAPDLFGEPVLVIGFAPAGEVVLVEVFADVAEPGDDVGIREAVLEHKVDLLADGGREPGDFAGATAVEEEAGWAVKGFDEAGLIRE
jgi:hypothetical protein